MKWEKVRLEDCCYSISDGDHQPPPKAQQGIPFVTISNINSMNQLDFSDTMFVPKEYYQSLDEKRKVRKGDVLYSVVGSFGIPVLIKEERPFVFQRHIAILRPKEDIVDSGFLFYTMLSRDFYAKADAVAIGAAQRTVSLGSLRNIKIDVPSLESQKHIADILSAYDDLIENNQKQIKLLEEAAQRLYKEWFVDLRFPGHENTKIVDGVPEGWSRTNINGILTFHRGYDLTKNEMKAGRYPAIGSTSIIGYHNEFKIKGPGIVTGRSGSLGKYQLVWDDFWPHNTSLYISNYKGHNIFFVYSLLQTVDFASLNNGGAIPTLNRNVLSNIEVIEPEKKLQDVFAKIAEPQYQKIKNLEKQNDRLKTARDLLLPKFMSGEVEV